MHVIMPHSATEPALNDRRGFHLVCIQQATRDSRACPAVSLTPHIYDAMA